MRNLLLSFSTLLLAIGTTGCWLGDSNGNIPFPIISNSTSSSGSSGGVILDAPTAPEGKMTDADVQTLVGGGGGATTIKDIANAEDGGPTAATSGLTSSVPGFGTLSTGSDGFVTPFRSPDAGILADTDLADCFQLTGSDLDNDSDGIKKSAGMTFDCELALGGESNFKFSGSYLMEDANDNKAFPKAGYSFTYDNLSFMGKSSGYTFSSIFNGGFDFDVVGSTYTMNAAFQVEFNTDAPWEQDGVGTYGYFMDWKMIPANAATPYAAGKIEFSGFYRNTQSMDLTLQYYSSNLTYDTTCNFYYKSGTLTFVDGAGGKLVYTYNNCAETVTFNGVAVP